MPPPPDQIPQIRESRSKSNASNHSALAAVDENVSVSMDGVIIVNELIECEGRRQSGYYFIPFNEMPDYYEYSWFKEILQYQLNVYDDDRCEEVLRQYEAIDWHKASEETLLLDSASSNNGTSAFDVFFHDIFQIVRPIYLRKPQYIQRILNVARAAFLAGPQCFLLHYRFFVAIFLPDSIIVEEGYLDYSRSPIFNLFVCSGLRVLKDRFPFSSIPVHLKTIELLETSLHSRSLMSHIKSMTAEGFHETAEETASVLDMMTKSKKTSV